MFVELVSLVALRWITPPTTPLMALRAVTGDGARREWVSLNDISPHVVTAFVTAEDQQFCHHRGIDRAALREAIRLRGRVGGSTISNQVARNVLLWPHRDVPRKLAELPLTGVTEFAWSKRRIFELYVNVVELGRGVFGVEEAAKRYWGTTAKRLTREQAALLAVTLPNPRGRDPRRPTRAMRDRAARIRVLMEQPVTRLATKCL